MNKLKNNRKMGFLKINSIKTAFIAMVAAMLIVVISANVSNSSNGDYPSPVSENVVQLTDSDFQKTIKEGVTLVDFWAVWCAPCRMQGPIIEEVAKEMGTKVTVAKLDVDKNKITSRQYGIRSIPTMMIFKDGKIVQTFVGLKDKQTLVNALNKHLGN